jgi:WD repeat-containing protein 19
MCQLIERKWVKVDDRDRELESERVFQSIDAHCINEHLYKCAVGGEGNKIKIFNMKNWKEIKKEGFTLPDNTGRIAKMLWAKNGQLLLVITTYGYMLGFLTHLPRLFSYHQNKLAILSSFTMVNLNYITDGKMDTLTTHNLEIEPTFLNIGASHLAAGVNNFVYLYKFFENGAFYQNFELIKKGDYFSMVSDAAISDTHLAVMTENKCYIETLSQEEDKIE